MSRKPATSIDVARLAGVSQPTVSRAFDPNASVSPNTRARVLAAAKELGYQPNVIARSLSTQRTNIVGLVLGNLNTSLFYPNLLDIFASKLQALNMQTLFFNAPPDRPVDDLLPRILGYQVDALVIASTTPSNTIIERCTQKGLPVVLFNRLSPQTQASSICCDNIAGGRQIANLLLDAGHQRIAFMAGMANSATNMMREKGFMQQLAKRGVANVIREQGDYTYDSGYQAMQRLLALSQPPDAVFCAADIMAVGAMDAVRESGLAVPDNVSIVGFDDIPVASWSTYHLTTIQQPIEEMVDTAVALITDPDAPVGQTHLLPGRLIVRSSAKLPPQLED